MATFDRAIPATNEIKMYFHCKRCLAELPAGQSPQEFVAVEVGFTPLGLQVWCKRHDCNVVHMDFQGAKHPVNVATVEH